MAVGRFFQVGREEVLTAGRGLPEGIISGEREFPISASWIHGWGLRRIRWGRILDYLRQTGEICDVLLTGGDSLTLSDEQLEFYLSEIRKISHIETVRIGTRAIVTYPRRITKKLVNMLGRYHPLWINTQFNHPKEITGEAAGIPIGNQTVLMRGINDDIDTMEQLMTGLIRIRVRPYYLYQLDRVKGTEQFYVLYEKGMEIVEELQSLAEEAVLSFPLIVKPNAELYVPMVESGDRSYALGVGMCTYEDGSPIEVFSLKDKCFGTIVDRPAPLPAQTAGLLEEWFLKLYRHLDCKDFGRVDFKLDGEGTPYFLEINPRPGLTEKGPYEACGAGMGKSYDEVIGEIIDSAGAGSIILKERLKNSPKFRQCGRLRAVCIRASCLTPRQNQ